jgi:hypothetical protein
MKCYKILLKGFLTVFPVDFQTDDEALMKHTSNNILGHFCVVVHHYSGVRTYKHYHHGQNMTPTGGKHSLQCVLMRTRRRGLPPAAATATVQKKREMLPLWFMRHYCATCNVC